MSWKDLIGLIIIIVGAVLFLYGSNAYNSLFGWGGIYLLVAGLVIEIVLEVYKAVIKRGS
jgi:drug/metabolite transporter (DMT)-like permease